MNTNKQAQAIISDIRLKHGSGDAYAPIIRWDEVQVISNALEAAEKRIAELEARTVSVAIKPPTISRAYSALAHVWTVQEVHEALSAKGIKLEVGEYVWLNHQMCMTC